MSQPAPNTLALNTELKHILGDPRLKTILSIILLTGGLLIVLGGTLSQFAVNQARDGRYGLAETLAAVAAKVTNSAREYSRLGDVYLEGQQYEQAAHAYQEALLRDLTYPGAHYKRGRMLFALGDFARAVSETTTELEMSPDHIKAKYIRGLAFSYLANWPAAERDFTDLLAVDPDWPWTRIDLSWVYLAQGKYKEAEVLLGKTLEKVPGSPWVLNNLGLALMHQGRYDEAVQTFSRAQQAVQEMTPEEFLTAYPLSKSWQVLRGQEGLERGILFNLAVVYERSGNLPRALESYQQILAGGNGETDTINNDIRGVTRLELENHLQELATKVRQ